MWRLVSWFMLMLLLVSSLVNASWKKSIEVVLLEPANEQPLFLTAGQDSLRIQFALVDTDSACITENDEENICNEDENMVSVSVNLRSSFNRRVSVTVAQDVAVAVGRTHSLYLNLPVNALFIQPRPFTIAPVAFHVEITTRRFFFFHRTLLAGNDVLLLSPGTIHSIISYTSIAAIRAPLNTSDTLLDQGRRLSKHDALMYLVDKGINAESITRDCLTSEQTHSACLAHRSFIYRMLSTIQRIQLWMGTYNVSTTVSWEDILNHPNINELDGEITGFLVGYGRRGRRMMKKMVKRWNNMAKKTKQTELMLPDAIVSQENDQSLIQTVSYLVSCDERVENHIVNLVGLTKRDSKENLLQPLASLLQERKKYCRTYKLQKRDGHGVSLALLALKILVQVVAVLLIALLFLPKSLPYWHYQHRIYYEPEANSSIQCECSCCGCQ